MPIQISEIAAYCGLCGFDDPIIRHDVMTMVQAMDEEWMTLQAERQKQQQPKGSARGNLKRQH